VKGSYVAESPQPITALHDRQLRLYQHRPLDADPPGISAYWALAYNMVLTNDRPGQPALLGAYDPDYAWHPTVTVSSTPAGQTTELAIPPGLNQSTLTLENLTGAQWTYLHGFVTGYYWYFHCANC